MSVLTIERRGERPYPQRRGRRSAWLAGLLSGCMFAAAPAYAEAVPAPEAEAAPVTTAAPAEPATALPASENVTFARLDFALGAPKPAAAVYSAEGEIRPSLLTLADLQPEPADDRSARIVPRDSGARLSFGDHFRSVRTEMALAFGYMTAVNLIKIAARGGASTDFKFHDEGLFGTDTRELGVDKLVHAHNTYLLSELIGARIRKKTGTTRGTALSGALLGSGLMLYSEIYDGFKKGFGFYDVAFNSMGAAFSVVRNTVPGLEEKLDFRALIIPNRQIYSPTGKEHYRQLRYMFALELGGFEGLRRSPLRFVELHAGYYGKGFTAREEDRGERPQRKLFVGVGLNLNELLFRRNPRTKFGRAASQLLDYWQPPYTYVHVTD